jgi:hypothetical protein
MIRNLTLVSLLLSAFVHAQVTVQYGMLDPNGMQLTMYLLTDPGSATEPSNGADQTWDLSTITLQPIGTLDFISAAGTPYAATYPAANWVWRQNVTGLGSQYMYLNFSSSAVEVLATGVPLETNNYTNPKTVLQFPFSLGQSVTDTYTDNDGTSSVTWTYAGHGTAITPVGTFSNIVKVTSTEDDLVLWNTAPLHPLVIDDGSSVLAFGPSSVGIGEQADLTALTYPNPCTDVLYVDVNAAAPWSLMDLQGRTLATGSFMGRGTQVIDIAALSTGSYVLVLGEGAARRSVRFSKA